MPVPEIAGRLRVSHNAVYVWRRRWLADGAAGLASRGPSGTGCRLSDAQLGAPRLLSWRVRSRTATSRISAGRWPGWRT
ncbi:helix-turn-helix domain-containing protein [Dactylosporangium sp. NPDC051484]|uniref:helix-turn-helix domain-containing protein n=1 Tax=Dactylosporangium sp. NPDC051484 TaxID=3154942 RepID=UPI003450ABA3